MRTAGLLGALFLIGLMLTIAGFEGRTGALLAAIFTPTALGPTLGSVWQQPGS